jgi:hypothetical protein
MFSTSSSELNESKFGFRALPKLNVIRLFAFVQKSVFLQEPVSTCFSFLIDWTKPGSEKLGLSALQGAEVIPIGQVFQSLCKELSSGKLIALCEVDSDFFGLIDPILRKKDNGKFNCFLRL